MTLTWQPVDLRSDPDEPEHLGDPGDLVVAAGLLLEAVGRPAWMADAGCRAHPELTWFPAKGEDVRPPKDVCGGCVVRRECLDYAIDQGMSLAGIWGGVSQRERRKFRGAPAEEAA